jgi:hypothetical protein
MEAVAAHRTAAVAVLLRTAEVGVLLRTVEVVVEAEVDHIVDPDAFPKGPPSSSRRAFGFLGSASPAEELSHNSRTVRVFYR